MNSSGEIGGIISPLLVAWLFINPNKKVFE